MRLIRNLCVVASLTAFASCGNNTNDTARIDSASVTKDSGMTDTTAKAGKIPSLKPQGAKPAWAQDMTDNMAVIIEKLASFNAKPIPTLTAAEARKNPTPTDAVMAVMKDNNIPMPVPQVDTMGKDIPVTGGNIHLRIYTPKTGKAPYPVIVYYHGGGWVIADINTYDASAAGLSEQTGAVVIGVNYREAPEHKFPTAHMDAFAAYQWALNNTASFNGDAKHIAVVGESAGGNLAANVSIMARDKKIAMPVYQVLVYPVANNDMKDESYTKYATAKPLDAPMMAWFVKNTLPAIKDTADPRIALVKADLKGLPPTTLITAELDPLHDDGKMLADKLKDAGVTVNYENYNGVTHEFFGMAALLKEAKDAQKLASDDLKSAFKK